MNALLILGLLLSMPDTAASSAQEAIEAAAAATEAAENIESATLEEILEFLEIGEEREPMRRVVSVSGKNPSITGKTNYQYVCGQVNTISITPPASGTIDVIFKSGTTAAILTVPNTVKWPDWFDPTSLGTERTYEINILDGIYGAVISWA